MAAPLSFSPSYTTSWDTIQSSEFSTLPGSLVSVKLQRYHDAMNFSGSRRVFSLFAALVCISAAFIGFQLLQLNPVAGTEFDVGNWRCWLGKCWRAVNPSDAGGYSTLPDIEFPLVSIAFSPDGTRIVAGLEDSTVRQWDAESGAPIGDPLLGGPDLLEEPILYEPYPGSLVTVAYSSDGTRILAGTFDGTVQQWNAEDGAPIVSSFRVMMDSPETFGEAIVMSMAYSPDGAKILAGISDGTVRRLDAGTGTTIGDLSIPALWLNRLTRSDPNLAVTILAYSPDGAEILAGTASGRVFRWNEESGELIRDLRMSDSITVTSVAYNPGGTGIVAGTAEGTVIQWNALTGVDVGIESLGEAQVTSVAYSPDGTRIAAGTANGAVWRLDAANGSSGGTLPGSLNSVLSVAYTPDGTRVFAVDYDGSVRVWRVASVCPPLLVILLVIAAIINGFVCWRVCRSSTPEPDEHAPALKSDKPIQDLNQASDAQKDIVKRISAFVRNPDASAPLTFAITGKWGTGKSSLMRLIQEKMRKYNAPCVWFNAWHHQNETHLFASLMESIRRDAVIANSLSFHQFASNLDFRLNLVRVRFLDRPVAVLVAGLVLTALLIFTVWSFQWAFTSYGQQAPATSDNGFAQPELALIETFESLSPFFVALVSFMLTLVSIVSNFNPLKGFGIKPASLLRTSRRWIQFPRFRDRLSFRDQFGRAFGEVCSALGARRLVIIIDDLDRCRPDQVVEILEAVNFLTSNGECFVFLGIDEHQVNHAVGLHYSEIAEQMQVHKQADHDNGKEGGRTPKGSGVMNDAERMAARQSYAKHYLQKLINVSIPVPVADANTPSNFATGTP